MANKQYITAREIMDIWGIKETKAYSLIRAANNELKEKGCFVVAGKAPRMFILRKLGLDESALEQDEPAHLRQA